MTQHIHNQDCFVEGTQVCGFAPAEQASKQVPTMTDEQIVAVWQGMPGGPDGWLKQFGYLQFARAILAAAPVAATEQAIPKGWKLVPAKPTAEMLKAGAESEDRHFGLIIHNCYCAMVDAAPTAPLATPADAGADEQTAQQQKECAPPFAAPASQHDLGPLAAFHDELNRITWEGEDEGWNLAIAAVQKRIGEILAAPVPAGVARHPDFWRYEHIANGLLRRAKKAEAELAEVLARLSTPAAPVTAEPVARQLISDIVKLWDSPSIDEDEHHEELARIEGEMRKFLGAPTAIGEPVAIHQWRHKPFGSFQPAWYDAPKEEAYARVDEIYEARTVYAAQVSPHPAAAHAAHDQKGGGNAGD